jgi:hypothetical protein
MPSRPRSGGVPRARSLFIRRLRAMGIRDRPTAPRSPWQNRHTERLIGSMPIGAHGVNAVITARKEHVAGCDRSGDQAGKAGVDRFRGAIADHQPHTLSSPAKACDDRQDERFDRICWLGRRVGHYARHDGGSIEPHQDLSLANLDLLDQGSHSFAKRE